MESTSLEMHHCSKKVHLEFSEWKEEESDEGDPSEDDFGTDPDPNGNRSPNNDQNNGRNRNCTRRYFCEITSN